MTNVSYIFGVVVGDSLNSLQLITIPALPRIPMHLQEARGQATLLHLHYSSPTLCPWVRTQHYYWRLM